MRTAFRPGERIVQESAMCIAPEVIIDLSFQITFGKLYLTSSRLIFEPDMLSIRTKEAEINIGDIAGLMTGWAKIFNLIPIYPTVLVSTQDGKEYRFSAFKPSSIGPRKWIGAIDQVLHSYVAAPAPVGGVESSDDREPRYYYEDTGNRIGPITRAEFEYNVQMGKIGKDTLVWNGTADWQPASNFIEIARPLGDKNSPPPLATDTQFVWAIVAAPIISVAIELLVGQISGLWYIVSVLLCLYDARRLKAAGHPTPQGWWVLLMPVYLWKRASSLRAKQIYTSAWSASFLAASFLTQAGGQAPLEAGACPLVTKIIQQQLSGSAECKGVAIIKDVGDGFYTATATLDNGNELRITIQDRGKDIFVQIPRQ